MTPAPAGVFVSAVLRKAYIQLGDARPTKKRADIDLKKQVSPVPSFAEMDVCPRCNLDMFDVFRSDFGTAWLAAKGLGRSSPAGGFQGKT